MLLCWRLGRWEIVRPRRQGAWVPGPSTSPLEDASKNRFESHAELEARSKTPRSTESLRARPTPAPVVASRVSGFNLRTSLRARTVASMRASSNNRWRGP